MPLSLAASMAIALAVGTPPGIPSDPESSAPSGGPTREESIASSASIDPAPSGSTRGEQKLEGGDPGEPWYALTPGKKLALAVELGAPQGAAFELVFRPWWWLRLNGGFAYNIIGTGIRGGVSVAPFRLPVTPTLNFDLGHYFSGDLTTFTSSSNVYEEALLHDAAYDFWSLQLGLEFGSRDGFLFYTRAGIAHLSASLSGQDVTNYANSQLGGQGTYAAGDANFSALIPCFNVGFLFFVL